MQKEISDQNERGYLAAKKDMRIVDFKKEEWPWAERKEHVRLLLLCIFEYCASSEDWDSSVQHVLRGFSVADFAIGTDAECLKIECLLLVDQSPFLKTIVQNRKLLKSGILQADIDFFPLWVPSRHRRMHSTTSRNNRKRLCLRSDRRHREHTSGKK